MCPHQTGRAQGARRLVLTAGYLAAFGSCRTQESPGTPQLGDAVPSTRVMLTTAHRPTAAALSADGQTLYLLALDDAGVYQLFRGALDAPPAVVPTSLSLSFPVALVVSQDGSKIVIVDYGQAGGDAPKGAVYAGDPGGALSRIGGSTTLSYPTAATLSADEQSVYITGREVTATGTEAVLWQVSLAGGDAALRYRGAPLAEPIGLSLASDGSLYVADAQGGAGNTGTIFRSVGDRLYQVSHQPLKLSFPCGLSAAGRNSPDLLFTGPSTTNQDAWLRRISPDGLVQDVPLPSAIDATCVARAAAADRWVAIDAVVPSSSTGVDPLDAAAADGAVWLLSP
jgi:hypothetical protein